MIPYTRRMLLSDLKMKLTNLTWRDGYQSTITSNKAENFRPHPLRGLQLMQLSAKAGFDNFEISGGQHFDNEIRAGRNPFYIMELQDKFFTDTNGKPTINPQMLFRGANVLGLTHFSPDVIEHFLDLYMDLGMKKIRSFDALNDIDNLTLPQKVKDKARENQVVLQGALCYGHYPQAKHRYTDAYYVNYARELIKAGFNSIVIKDMSGQLDHDKAKSLVIALKTALGKDIPVELHIHSTNQQASLGAIQGAREAGVDGIETVEGPLRGGSSHHDLQAINDHDKVNPVISVNGHPAKQSNEAAFKRLQDYSNDLFGEMAKGRVDTLLAKDKEDLCAIGIPGGAMPFAIAALENAEEKIIRNNQTYFLYALGRGELNSVDDILALLTKEKSIRKKIDRAAGSTPIWDATLKLFKEELPRVCQDANYPLLVTPTADICYTQAVRNMAYGKGLTTSDGKLITNPWDDSETKPDASALQEYYKARYDWTTPDQPGGGKKGSYDPRFVKLVLGYYGQMKSYGVGEEHNSVYRPSNGAGNYFRACDEMISFCSGIKSMPEDAKEPVSPEQQIYQTKLAQTQPVMPEIEKKVDAFIKAYGYKALSFGSKDQLMAMFALFPEQTKKFFDELPDSFVQRNDNRDKLIGGKRVNNPIGVQDPFPDFGYIIQPLLDQIEAIIISGKPDIVDLEKPLAVKISQLGKLGKRMFDVYERLPLIGKANIEIRFLEGLEKVSAEFRDNIAQLRQSFDNLYRSTQEAFLDTSVADLISSLRAILDLPKAIEAAKSYSIDINKHQARGFDIPGIAESMIRSQQAKTQPLQEDYTRKVNSYLRDLSLPV